MSSPAAARLLTARARARGSPDGFSDERKAVIARDFTVSNFSYRHLLWKTLRRSHRFFAVVVLFQLFAVIPTRHPQRVPLRAAWIYSNQTLLQAGFNHSALAEGCEIGAGWAGLGLF